MGGAEKVLLDIVKTQNMKFEIHVLTFKDDGPLKQDMHHACKVFTLFSSNIHYLIFRKFKFYRKNLINDVISRNGYDKVIGFMEGKSTDLVTDIDVNILKIAWIHNDFRKLGMLGNDDEMYRVYSKIDKIVYVSNAAREAFLERFPLIRSKNQVIYNLIDEKAITHKSLQKPIINNVFTFLNVGMLRKQKCQDRLIRIASKLKKLNYKFNIQIIGDGPLKIYLNDLINELDVGDKVVMLGLKENPYQYIKNCDCFVLSSAYEGYSIVVKEALFLKKLILTTDVVGPREILSNGKYGLIVKNDEESLFEKMKEILESGGIYTTIIESMKKYRTDNDVISSQLFDLFDE